MFCLSQPNSDCIYRFSVYLSGIKTQFLGVWKPRCVLYSFQTNRLHIYLYIQYMYVPSLYTLQLYVILLVRSACLSIHCCYTNHHNKNWFAKNCALTYDRFWLSVCYGYGHEVKPFPFDMIKNIYNCSCVEN